MECNEIVKKTGIVFDSHQEILQLMSMKDGFMTGEMLCLVVMYDKEKRKNGERYIQTAIPIYLYRPYNGKDEDIPMNWPSEKIERYLKEELGWDKLPRQTQEKQFMGRLKSSKNSVLAIKHIYIPMTRDFLDSKVDARFVIQDRVSMIYKEQLTYDSKIKDLYIIHSVAENDDGEFEWETLTPVFIGSDDKIELPLNNSAFGFDTYRVDSDSQYILQSLNRSHKPKKGKEKMKFSCQRKYVNHSKTPLSSITSISYSDVEVEDDVVYWGKERNMVDLWLKSLESITRKKKHPADETEMLWDYGNQNVTYLDKYRPRLHIDQQIPYDEDREGIVPANFVKGEIYLPHKTVGIVKVYPVRINKHRMGKVGFNYYE